MTEKLREISLDTETTGFNADQGDRIVEIGCMELINKIPTGEKFHVYINPERIVPAEAIKVHGLDNQFLKDKPVFSQIARDFLGFIGSDPLVIHNAQFDMKFLNSELRRMGISALDNPVVDTLVMAQKMFPGKRVNLDALCRHFKVDNTNRTLHGALIDANLLSSVYLHLTGGPNHALDFGELEDAPGKQAPKKRLSRSMRTRVRTASPVKQPTEKAAVESNPVPPASATQPEPKVEKAPDAEKPKGIASGRLSRRRVRRIVGYTDPQEKAEVVAPMQPMERYAGKQEMTDGYEAKINADTFNASSVVKGF